MDNSKRSSQTLEGTAPLEETSSAGSKRETSKSPPQEGGGGVPRAGNDKQASQTDSERSYRVGYGKPPAETRFYKGHPGYKRRKRPPALAMDFRQEVVEQLNERVTVTENGTRRRITVAEVIVRKFGKLIGRGDAKARAQLMQMLKWADRASDGKLKEPVQERRDFQTIMQDFCTDMQKERYLMSCDLQEDKTLLPKLEAVITGKGNGLYALCFLVLISMSMKISALRKFLHIGAASGRGADDKHVAPLDPTLKSR